MGKKWSFAELELVVDEELAVGGGDGAGRSGCPGIRAAVEGRFQRGETAEEEEQFTAAGELFLASCCLQSRSTESKRLKLPVELSRNSEPERICGGERGGKGGF